MQIIVNGETITTPDGGTIADLVEHLAIPHPAYAIEVNKRVVPRREHGDHQLQPGDEIEVVTLVGGG